MEERWRIMMVEVVWAVLRQNGRFLLAQRSLSDHSGGTWTFPGGKIDPKDTGLSIATHRELKEEVGLDGHRFRELFHTHIDKYHVHIFLCDQWRGELKPACDDIIGVGWFTLADMYALGESLAPFVCDSLLSLSYLLQHYDHHPDEWRDHWSTINDI